MPVLPKGKDILEFVGIFQSFVNFVLHPKSFIVCIVLSSLQSKQYVQYMSLYHYHKREDIEIIIVLQVKN